MTNEQENAIKCITDIIIENSFIIKNIPKNEITSKLRGFAKMEFNIELSECDTEKILELSSAKIRSQNLRRRNKQNLEDIKKRLNSIDYVKKDLEKLNKMLKLSGELELFNIEVKADFHINIENSIEQMENRIKYYKDEIQQNLAKLKFDDTYLISKRPSYRESLIESVRYDLDENFRVKNEWDSIRGMDNFYINDELF